MSITEERMNEWMKTKKERINQRRNKNKDMNKGSKKERNKREQRDEDRYKTFPPPCIISIFQEDKLSLSMDLTKGRGTESISNNTTDAKETIRVNSRSPWK
jgi:hypothetical protein